MSLMVKMNLLMLGFTTLTVAIRIQLITKDAKTKEENFRRAKNDTYMYKHVNLSCIIILIKG